MESHDILYAAGFFDGEGCITTSGTTGFRATLSNTNKDVLIWFVNTFGGNIQNQCLPENPRWNKAWKWSVCARKDVRSFLQKIYPFLKIKKEQARIVLMHLEKYPTNKTGRHIPNLEIKDFIAAKQALYEEKHRKEKS